MKFPSLKHESVHWQNNVLIAGIDEVGRGCFAGPLTAAGVILKPNLSEKELSGLLSCGINDSKLIKSGKRKEIIKFVQKYILYLTIQSVSVDHINRFGIGIANKLVFQMVAKDAESKLKNTQLSYLTDCFPIPETEKSIQENIIRGDQISISIALASIAAKVHRDSYMEKLGLQFPEYGFDKHKGYGTKFHRDIIKKSGITPHHRSKFVARFV